MVWPECEFKSTPHFLFLERLTMFETLFLIKEERANAKYVSSVYGYRFGLRYLVLYIRQTRAIKARLRWDAKAQKLSEDILKFHEDKEVSNLRYEMRGL